MSDIERGWDDYRALEWPPLPSLSPSVLLIGPQPLLRSLNSPSAITTPYKLFEVLAQAMLGEPYTVDCASILIGMYPGWKISCKHATFCMAI